MDKEFASKILQAGRDTGADFVEIFVEERRSSSLEYKDKKVEGAVANTEYGVGIRLIFGTEVLYTHTSDDSEENLFPLIKNLAFGRKGDSRIIPPFAELKYKNLHSIIKDPRKIGQVPKLDIVKRVDSVARQVSSHISQVSARAYDVLSQIEIFNSDGLYAQDRRCWSRLGINVTAENGGERFLASESPGAMGGFEVFENIDLDDVSIKAAERALLMLDAEYLTGGQIPVVMGNGFGGVIFHEACGHPLETESIRRNASPFCDKLGEKIANEAVTAIDDGTIANSWGSINIDDEGMPTQKTTLIENGILKSYMSDYVGAKEVGVPRTGSGRRQSYHYAPVARMRNTYIAAGQSDFGSMIYSADGGIFAKKMGGGSVNPATGEFNFSVEEGYRIKNGKVAEPIRGATLIGKGHEIIPRISMVGSDLEYASGMCGASSGSVPVTVGQPTIKVDKILVGGR